MDLRCLNNRCGARCSGSLASYPRGVLDNKILLLAVAVRGIEIVVLHLGIRLVVVPALIQTIDGTDIASAVTPAGAVHVEDSGSRVVGRFQKRGYRLIRRNSFIDDRYIDVLEARSFRQSLLLWGVIREIDDRVYTDSLESSEIFLTGPSSTIKPVVHLPKIRDLDAVKLARASLSDTAIDTKQTYERRKNNGKDLIFHYSLVAAAAAARLHRSS
jgi:hypothetical protein